MKIKNIKPVVIFSFLFIFGLCSFFALADEGLSSKAAVFRDSDQDGLSDGEEKMYGTDPNKADTDNDGYSDGVEVKSGYDPTKPAPGDKIMPLASAVLGDSTSADDSQKDNLTAKLSDKLSEFIKANEGKEGSMSVENLDAIIEESLGDEINEDASASFDESAIKVKKQDYSQLSSEERTKKENEDAAAYFKSILYILVNNAPAKIASQEDLQSALEEFAFQFQALIEGSAGNQHEYFADLAERGKMIAEQINLVEVPEKLLDLHKEGLQLLVQTLDLEKITIDPNDQVGLIINLSKIQNLSNQGATFQENFTAKMAEAGIVSGFDLILGN